MKHLLLVAVLLTSLVFSGPAFGMGSRPDPNTFNGCNQRPYSECGDVYKMNLEQYGQWQVCATKIWDSCRCKFRPDVVMKYNTDKSCTNLV